jgi:NADP-dependent 3-hydroxy acid dehydrogenase YdfG
MKRLEGKVAVITGGNSRISLASAKRLREEGAKIAISGRDAKTLESAAKEIGEGTLAVQGDVSKLADIGKIDVLFVNAGIAIVARYAMTNEELFDKMYNINVKVRTSQSRRRFPSSTMAPL